MIESAFFQQFNKEHKELEDSVIPLWPLKKKIVKVKARSSADYFVFNIILNKSYEHACLLLNDGAERIDLFFESEAADGAVTLKSSRLKASGFMRYNVGIYEFVLLLDGDEYRLNPVRAESAIMGSKHLDAMFQVVHNSEHFSLLIEQFSRANTAVSAANEVRETYTAWKVLFVIGRFCRVIEKLLLAELIPFSKLRNRSSVERYSNKSRLSSGDVTWVATNPQVLELDGDGVIMFRANRYSPTVSKTTSAVDSGGTRENELINYCLERMKIVLDEMFNISQLIPKDVFERSIDNLNRIHDDFMQATGCRLARYQIIDLNQYRRSPQRLLTLESITDWLSLTSGNEVGPGEGRIAVPQVTTVFEYYCLVMIINSIVADGYELTGFEYRANEPTKLSFGRAESRFDLFYEPRVFREARSLAPVVISKTKPTEFLNPDFVISFYESDTLSKVFVLDAKFSSKERVNASIEANGLGPAIFYKYGLYLHDIFNRPVDAVIALYPSSDGRVSVKNFRDGAGVDSIKPRLISAAIPVERAVSSQTLLDIKRIITG